MNTNQKNIVGNIIKNSFFIVIIIVFFTYFLGNIFFKNNLIKLFGFEFAIVQSSSMYPKIKKYDFVIITSNTRYIKQNDIIVFFDNTNTHKIIHRVVKINNTQTSTTYVTKGDNNPQNDNGARNKSDIYAKYLISIPLLGLFISFLTSVLGIATMLINLIFVIIIITLWSMEKQDYLHQNQIFYD